MSEIHITECIIDPWFLPSVAADYCYPSSTKGDDALKGKWVRVDRNLKEQLSMKDLVRLSLLSKPISISQPRQFRTFTTAERGGTISLS